MSHCNVKSEKSIINVPYIGRLAPSPSGHLHVGHARTFWLAQERAHRLGGKLIMRVEDIDVQRCKPNYLTDMIEDLHWFGINWDEGYDLPAKDNHQTYIQSKRFPLYEKAWKLLYDRGYIYPCRLSRKDVDLALSAPHDNIPSNNNNNNHSNNNNNNSTNSSTSTVDSNNEIIFPARLRPDFMQNIPYPLCGGGNHNHFPANYQDLQSPYDLRINWRFRIPDESNGPIVFEDGHCGTQSFLPGVDFGDFLIWRLDGYPSYELAVVVDDLLMKITEVVRGQDLVLSTARQLLLMQALFGLDHTNPTHHWSFFTVPTALSLSPYVERNDREVVEGEGEGKHKDAIQSLSSQSSSECENENDILDNTNYRYKIPAYYHVSLVCDENGVRLAKRNFAKSLRNLREEGQTPAQIKQDFHFHIAS